MTGRGLRDDTPLGAIRLDWWAASDWNGARNTFGIPGRLRRNPHIFFRFVQHHLRHGPMLDKCPERTSWNIARGTRLTVRSRSHSHVVLTWRWPPLPIRRGSQESRLQKCRGVLVGPSGNSSRHLALRGGRRQIQFRKHDGSPSEGLDQEYDSARTIDVRL
jgi:hypothetical protein